VPAEQCLGIVEDLALLAGPAGMVGGQAADILGEQGITDAEELKYIHTHKTGDMIVFSLKAGARTAGATDEQLWALERFGYGIGLAFQIQDDILDLTGDESKLGKPLKSDVKQHKVTYPFLIGLEASRQRVGELTEAAKQAILDAGFPRPERLLELADFLMKRDH
jgi:geranylgeranyl diphosphate synthase type II